MPSGTDLSDILTKEDSRIDAIMLDYELMNLIAFHLDMKDREIIPPAESASIITHLVGMLGKKISIDPEEEDVHAYVENRIREKAGDSAGNLRLFISRNEQSQCNLRSFYIDHLLILAGILLQGSASLEEISSTAKGKIPGFTHWRQAMPVSISTYLDYISRINMDLAGEAVSLIRRLRKFSPMGLGSGYGSLSNASFDQVAEYLGFAAGPKNPVAAAFYRGFDDIDVMSLLVRIMIFYSRVSADLILYSSGSNPFLILPESFLTGSSLMPNKRNPDFLEMVQGYASQFTGDLAAAAAILAGSNTGYHREFQVSKDRTVSNILLVESISKHMNQLMQEMKFDPTASREAIENQSYALHEAYELFRKTGKWKESYQQAGSMVRSGKRFSERDPIDYFSVDDSDLKELEGDLLTLYNAWNGPRKKLVKMARSLQQTPG